MNWRAFSSTVLILVLATCTGAFAAPGGSGKASADDQIDGISDQICDNLWSGMDGYFHVGDYPRSVALARIIVQYDPHFVECYSTGGWLMESLGNKDDAEAFYQQGVKNNPSSSLASYSLGFFYYNTLKDYRSATAAFQSDAKSPGSDDKDWKMLAHSYEHMGSYELALQTWTVIKKRWPMSPAVDRNLQRVKAIVAKSHAT